MFIGIAHISNFYPLPIPSYFYSVGSHCLSLLFQNTRLILSLLYLKSLKGLEILEESKLLSPVGDPSFTVLFHLPAFPLLSDLFSSLLPDWIICFSLIASHLIATNCTICSQHHSFLFSGLSPHDLQNSVLALLPAQAFQLRKHPHPWVCFGFFPTIVITPIGHFQHNKLTMLIMTIFIEHLIMLQTLCYVFYIQYLCNQRDNLRKQV